MYAHERCKGAWGAIQHSLEFSIQHAALMVMPTDETWDGRVFQQHGGQCWSAETATFIADQLLLAISPMRQGI
jgi:hypothetical protein